MNQQTVLSAFTSTVLAEHRGDGTILLRNSLVLPPLARSIPDRLGYWAEMTPEAIYLSEEARTLCYGEAEQMRQRIAGYLLAMPLSVERPLMIMAGNSIDHAIFMLAATSVGVPVAVVSPAYAASAHEGWDRLAGALDQVTPGMILTDDPAAIATAVSGAGSSAPVHSLHDLSWLEAIEPATTDAIDSAERSVGPNSVAKLLFTSGSTGTPKAVINTQRMMVSNMQALALVWPFLEARPPVLVDWLPWNHTFGGNCCFNIALWFGGHLHIDQGRPVPALIERTVDAVRRHRPTVYFNVPIGYELLLPVLERDADFAQHFFGGLDFLFSAGAPMPAGIRARLEAAASKAVGRVPSIAGGWGSTETAPFSTVLNFTTSHAANLGVPLPGTIIKLMPDGDRYELRVRGPNVTPGYWRDRKSSAAAFDEDGFYRIGDAGLLADPENPSAGILFDGRVAENFKLSSGTFVNVGGIRVAVVTAGERLISDAIVAGEGRADLSLLLFPNEAACRDFLGIERCGELGEMSAWQHPAVRERLIELLRAYNDTMTGSSTRIARFLLADEPPSAPHNEITEKGYINQRRVIARRSVLIDELFERGITL